MKINGQIELSQMQEKIRKTADQKTYSAKSLKNKILKKCTFTAIGTEKDCNNNIKHLLILLIIINLIASPKITLAK